MSLFDIQAQVLAAALKDIHAQLEELEASGDLKGSLTAEKQISLISAAGSMEECVKGAVLVQVWLAFCYHVFQPLSWLQLMPILKEGGMDFRVIK